MNLTHKDLECHHQFPDDWVFGGANGLSPMADARFEPTTYFYYDQWLELLFMTQMFWCDEVAIEYFTVLRDNFKYEPMYIGVKRPGQEKPILIQVTYDSREDLVYDRRA